MSQGVIQAAGGVLWRPGADGDEIAVVHRPRYDDWSLPKGKLQPGETAMLGAVREVLEETGHHGTVGRRVGAQRYDKALPTGPAPKVVRFWAMRVTGGSFIPNEEVDELRWLPHAEALAAMTLDRDRAVLTSFAHRPYDTWPLVIVRHGSAGSREKWRGNDARRPLDSTGKKQTAEVTEVLRSYGVRRVVSSDVDRCTQTVKPYAAKAKISIDAEHLLSEPGYAADPRGAVEACLRLLKEEEPIALCTQRRVIAPLTSDLLRTFGVDSGGVTLAKGAVAVMHLAHGSIVDVEQHPPLDDDPDEGEWHGAGR